MFLWKAQALRTSSSDALESAGAPIGPQYKQVLSLKGSELEVACNGVILMVFQDSEFGAHTRGQYA